jgi:outer membrane receptor protein involved in Fe transport
MLSLRLKSAARASTALGAVLLIASAIPASAQVETVVVTAERHSEDVQSVPESVTTIPDDELKSMFNSGQDIRAIAARVPSLYAESSNGRVAPRFYIRGLGNADFDLAASQPVSVIEDGIVEENVVLKSAPLYDQQAVEIDRGPQGTLFGRNTTAGIVKFTSVAPGDKLDGYLTGSYGELGTADVDGAITIPVVDGLSVRASGMWQHRDNYISNGYLNINDALGGYDERAGRVQVLWKPSDDFSVLLNIHGRSLDGTAAVFRANILGPGNDHLNQNYKPDTVYFDGGFTDPITGVADPKNENPQKYDGLGESATMEYDFAGMKLTAITGYEETHGYSRGDIDGGVCAPAATPVPAGVTSAVGTCLGAPPAPPSVSFPGNIFFPSESQDGLDYLHQFTQEIHLASDNSSPLFWQVGGFYFSTKYQDTTYPYFIPGTSVRQSNVAWAMFGSATYHITNALSVTGGVRWTSDVKAMTANGPLDTITTPVRTSGDNVSWDVSVLYALDENVNVYARAATGFRGPSIQGRNIAFNNPPGNFSIARSEKITSYEGGLKMLLDDHKLRLNIDGYSYHLADPQFSAVGGAAVGNSIVLVNARAGNAYGIELDSEYDPDENWSFTGGGSLNHTRISDNTLSTAGCAQCVMENPADPAHPGDFLVNGNPFPNAPEYIVNATAKYTYPLDSGAQLYIYTDWYLQGYTNFLLYKSAEYHSNGNYEGGLRAGYIAPDNLWEAALYVRNITDKANVQGGIDFDDNTGFVSDPRVIGVELTGHLN